MSMERVNDRLKRLQMLTAALVTFGVISVGSFASFAVYEVTTLRSQQTQLAQLTEDLCTTLERAGILIQGSTENPCDR